MVYCSAILTCAVHLSCMYNLTVCFCSRASLVLLTHWFRELEQMVYLAKPTSCFTQAVNPCRKSQLSAFQQGSCCNSICFNYPVVCGPVCWAAAC